MGIGDCSDGYFPCGDSCCEIGVESCCSDGCVNTDTNDNHCGECDNSCEDCSECTDGSCSSACEAGEHCSSSGNCVECTEDSHCTDGYCSSNECEPCDSDGDGSDSPQCGGSDCDDDNEDVYPGATEVCDGVDNDCDGDVDEGVGYCHEEDPDCTGSVDCDSYDGDSCPTSSGCEVYGGECTVSCEGARVNGACELGDEYSTESTFPVRDDDECKSRAEKLSDDCTNCHWYYEAYDDGSRCAGFDSCDSSDCEDGITGCYYDDVGDCSSNDDRSSCESSSGCDWSCCVSNYGDSCSTDKGVCSSGTIQCDGSCSGLGPTESPESSCSDGLDNDCDGKTDCDDSDCADASACTVTCYRDADGDGFGDPGVSDTFTADSCSDISGWVANDGDCDDSSDCLAPGRVWYHDADEDGYVNETDTRTQCSWPGVHWYARAGACSDE
ncbi:MAG: MopE-related protein [Candidatus Woesearchaeota archaeon]